jgi:hypothetical protein
MDNVFIEPLWRSLKHEDVYLKGYADGRETHSGIAQWVGFYTNTGPHQARGNRTPMAVWREGISGGLPETAVDMTPRLDKAKALPACPATANCGLITGERSGPNNPTNKPGQVVPQLGSTSNPYRENIVILRVLSAHVLFHCRPRPRSIGWSHLQGTP